MAESPTRFTIRPAAEEDLPTLVDIESRVHLVPWSKESFSSEFEKPFSRIWVLTDDETDQVLAGYIIFWLLAPECRVLNLAVDLPFRGLGFAKKLLQAGVREAIREGLGRVSLEVRKSNLPAVCLYQNNGFSISRVQKQYYSDGEDAYLMELALEGKRDDF